MDALIPRPNQFRAGVGNLRLFLYQDVALQFHAQILIIILFYFLKLIKNIVQKTTLNRAKTLNREQ